MKFYCQGESIDMKDVIVILIWVIKSYMMDG